MDARARRRLFERLRAANPRPSTELVYRSPYQLLVSVMLSAQATDRSVNQATRSLFRVAGTPEKMLRLGEDGLAGHIRTIGLWRVKARHVIEASRLLLENRTLKTPSKNDLENLAILWQNRLSMETKA